MINVDLLSVIRRRNLKQLYRDLVTLGYGGSYDRVAAFAGDRRRRECEAAHFKLSHSRAFMLRAYPQQTHEMLIDAHSHCLAALGGIPQRGIYDNMKTAVDLVGRGKQRKVNARVRAMVSHLLFEADFCNPTAGWEKGHVEKNTCNARHRIWQTEPRISDSAALNVWLEARCRGTVAGNCPSGTTGSLGH